MEVEGQPALQVIILGSGGGPLENKTTAFLVRSFSSNWARGSVLAVDAGVHLSAIAAILEETQPAELGGAGCPLPHVLGAGPFAGLELPFRSAAANAGHVGRSLVDTYLITHPHLDHISGFVVNTAAKPGGRPKRLAGLPSTIAAFKHHIFNNVIWPNLSDENNGAGLVTYMRLVEGGSPALGEGDSRGYLEVVDGLAVKVLSVSHGHCMEKHSHRGSVCSIGSGAGGGGGGGGPLAGRFSADGPGLLSPRGRRPTMPPDMPRLLHQLQQQQYSHSSYYQSHPHSHQPHGHSIVLPPGYAAPSGSRHGSVATIPSPLPTPPGGGGAGGGGGESERICVVDSSAYFIRDTTTGREVLIFGDVEPDAVSLSPRNHTVWAEAAPKIARGSLAGILIECSYDNSQTVDRLYGHLTPHFVLEELCVLGAEVEAVRAAAAGGDGIPREAASLSFSKKRKRELDNLAKSDIRRRSVSTHAATPSASNDDAVSPKTIKPSPGRMYFPPGALAGGGESLHLVPPGQPSPHLSSATAGLTLESNGNGHGHGRERGSESSTPPHPSSPSPFSRPPLKGVKVVIIHVKERLDDNEDAGQTILRELIETEAELQTGVEFVLSYVGQSISL